jgi:CheY-like chemotaxis protein
MRVLLVDDAFALRLLAKQLAQAGIDDVQMSTGANEALQMIGAAVAGFDVLFVDLNMPGMDGVAFLRHLAGRRFRGGLVLVSGEDQRVLNSVASLAKAHRLRVLGSLRKPVPKAQLQQVLEALPTDRSTTVTAAVRRSYGADELRAAIADGMLVNHYQPQVALAGGAVIAVEALVRWHHPDDGLVYPDQFVPLAEASGLSAALARAVLARALDDSRDWNDGRLNLQLAVNVSINDLVALAYTLMQRTRAIALQTTEPAGSSRHLARHDRVKSGRFLGLRTVSVAIQ